MTQSIRFVDRADLERSETEVARLVEENRRLEERLAVLLRRIDEMTDVIGGLEEAESMSSEEAQRTTERLAHADRLVRELRKDARDGFEQRLRPHYGDERDLAGE